MNIKHLFKCSLIIFFSLLTNANTYFPDSNWSTASPENFGIKPSKVKNLIDLSFEDESTLGVVLIKNGKIIGEQYADGYDYLSHGTSWSMAKSYYAALIGVSIDRGEIKSLDDPVKEYLDYFDDERGLITIRDLLNMSSGLEFPDHEHEKMFFQKDHLSYAKGVGVEKPSGKKFEYNNVNSMIIGDILLKATGKRADILLGERILKPIGVTDYKLWKDEAGNVMAYCCVDMSIRDYSRIGLLFSRNGYWNGKQIIPKDFIDETFQVVWETPNRFSNHKRYYSLHWWVSKFDQEGRIFNTSGKFGQYTFVDRTNDVIFTRVTKYDQNNHGDVQKWGPLQYFRWLGVTQAIKTARVLLNFNLIENGTDVITPTTDSKGESNEFYNNYQKVVEGIADLSRG